MPSTKRGALSASGLAVKVGEYVEDVFSTYVYEGNGASRSIDNGIDLDGEGGMVWTKSRSTTGTIRSHLLTDTERGATKVLSSDGVAAEATYPNSVTSFNSDGFSIGTDGYINASDSDYASWTFRKAKKFFDVVTYTGNGVVGRTVTHALGSVPGMYAVRRLDAGNDFIAYHRSLGSGAHIWLSSTSKADLGSMTWNATDPTSTEITLANGADTNFNNGTYVVYLFAHDAGGFGDDGDESIIKCGTYTTDASEEATISLGWEPQYVMFKRTDSNPGGDWCIYDSMRGLAGGSAVGLGGGDALLEANTADAEADTNRIAITADGFNVDSYGASRTYIYMAIRRPMKVPESASEVYNTITRTGTGAVANVTGLGFTPDFMTTFYTAASGQDKVVFDRLRGPSQYLTTSSTSQEIDVGTNGLISFDMDGFTTNANGYANNNGSAFVNHCFKRAPGFMDVVAYTGTGNASEEAHNLGVIPELIIVKSRTSSVENWYVPIGPYSTGHLFLNLDNSRSAFDIWPVKPTSTVFTTYDSDADTNLAGGKYITYLFATLSGVSKVGSYTGTAATLTVDCGFAAGARFILIKRTDAAGDWYMWDSARGIVAGDDPYLLLNSTAAEVTNTDYIDPLSAGFTVTSSAPAALNASGGEYIFLAIA